MGFAPGELVPLTFNKEFRFCSLSEEHGVSVGGAGEAFQLALCRATMPGERALSRPHPLAVPAFSP